MNLVEGLGVEIRRVTTILGYYEEIGPAGTIATMLIRESLTRATIALGSGDPVAMIAAVNELKEYSE